MQNTMPQPANDGTCKARVTDRLNRTRGTLAEMVKLSSELHTRVTGSPPNNIEAIEEGQGLNLDSLSNSLESLTSLLHKTMLTIDEAL